MPLDCSRGLFHLHQGDDGLLHPGAAAAAEQDHRQPLFGSPLKRQSDPFTHNPAHAADHKIGITDANDCLMSADLTVTDGNSLRISAFGLCGRQLFRISRRSQRVADPDFFKPGLKGGFVQHHCQTLFCANGHILSAVGANVILVP